MSARFRIRTARGQELSFASHEVFAEFVRSGDLSPDDVVYDAETREWSSARTHPVVLQIEIEAEEEAQAESTANAPSAPRAAPAPPSVRDIRLDLAPAAVQLTPEQETAAFVAKMQAERAADLDVDEEAPLQGFKMEQGASGLVEGIAEPAAPRREEPRPAPREAPPREAPPARYEPPPRYEPPARQEAPERPEPPKRKKKTGTGAGRRYAPFVILVIALGAAGVYFGPELLAPTTGGDSEARPDGAVAPPAPPPLISDNEEALRRRAQERFLSSTQALLRGLDPIPETWLQGRYLSAPSDYAAVRDVWEEYLTTIREVRAGDDDRYREAYLRALDDARIVDAARTLRLASALSDFQAAAAARNRHYDRVEALATVALQGHDALAGAEGTIAYEPATGPGVSADPVIEAAGRGPEAQALLEQVLDLILAELQGEGGAGEAENVREWVSGGLLDAVAN